MFENLTTPWWVLVALVWSTVPWNWWFECRLKRSISKFGCRSPETPPPRFYLLRWLGTAAGAAAAWVILGFLLASLPFWDTSLWETWLSKPTAGIFFTWVSIRVDHTYGRQMVKFKNLGLSKVTEAQLGLQASEFHMKAVLLGMVPVVGGFVHIWILIQ